jgi:DNA polymerase-1
VGSQERKTKVVEMNKRVRLQVRDAACTGCRLSGLTNDSLDICVTGSGLETASVLVVSKSAGGKAYHQALSEGFSRAGLDYRDMFHTAAVKCRVWDTDPSARDVKACRTFLDREIGVVKPGWIIALGNEALLSLTGHSGIMKYRGKTFDHPSGAKVFATISPSMMIRNPRMADGFTADLSYFAALVTGKVAEREPIEVRHVMTLAGLKAMDADIVSGVELASFDVESTGFNEWEADSKLVSISISVKMPGGEIVNYAVPLYHPQSPFRRDWEKVLRFVCRILQRIRKRVAHNGKFDLRWMRQFAHVDADFPLTFDTMLAAHLLDETRTKALKPLCQQLLGAEPWGIDTHDLLRTPLPEVLEYNGLDTYWTLRLYDHLKKDLIKQPRLAKLMAHLLVGASEEITTAEINAIYVDSRLLRANWKKAEENLHAIEDQLHPWLPKELPFPVNFNPSKFLRWFLFEHLGLPVLARGKPKDDGRPGDPSVSEGVMMELAEQHEVPKLLLERTNWARKCGSFFEPWSEQLTEESRLHTTFKLTGTVTGRLSSGKPDEEKVTAKKQVRGFNMQQVPRDPLMRGCFGSRPGWWFVQGDQSQVELRIAAEASGERNMIWHYQNGLDLHTAMAERMMGKSKAEILADPILAVQWKEIRKHAKPVNFGYLYGASWGKFQDIAWLNYGLRFTNAEAQASRQAFFEMWPDLVAWHAKQKRLVYKYHRVESPLGRVRHLPDILSPNREVQAEAERQAINSPVQSLASDITLLALTNISRLFRTIGMRSIVVGTVHDSILFEIPEEEMARALVLIKQHMENPPLEKLFGYTMRVPLVADITVGRHWAGDTKELTTEQALNWDPRIMEAA